jgi:RimJ/RimL family protein N-acetyltransferase
MCALDIRPAIATERLMLRGPTLKDAGRIAALANDFAVAGMTSHVPHPYARADAAAFLARDLDPAREALFAIEHPADGVIGMLGFSGDDGRRPELGYWLGRAYWGLGYATEAAKAALGWAGRGWRKRLVAAGHFAENRASGEVLCKAGFLYTGEVQHRTSTARREPVATRMMVWLA